MHPLRQAPSLPQPGSVFLEELTWMEVRDAIAGGKTTVIIPTGGTEQNGPHIVLGKHNYLVKYKAGEIASRLGNALVAPVVAYVPEGNVDPPTAICAMPAPHDTQMVRQRLEMPRKFNSRVPRVGLVGDAAAIGGSAWWRRR